MLSLAAPRVLDELLLYEDADGLQPPRLYVRRATPLLGRTPDGAPDLFLTLYRGALVAGQPVTGGGLLALSVALAPRPEEWARAREALPTLLPGAPAAELRPFPLKSARVALAVGIMDADVRAAAASEEANLSGDQRASALFELNPDGVAALLAEGAPAALWVRYELGFFHRVQGLELRLWCESRAAHRALSEVDPELLSSQGLGETLSRMGLAGMRLEERAGVSPDYVAQVREIGLRVLEGALSAELLERDPSGALHPRSVAPTSSLNLLFRDGQAMEALDVAEALIPAELEPSRILTVDLGGEAGAFLEIRVRCRVDFQASPIDRVKVTLRYGPQGEETGEMVFSDATGVQLFRPRRRGDLSRYAYKVDVYYRGGAPPRSLPWQDSADRLLVLSLDGLGVLRQTVRLGAWSDPRVRAARVELRYDALSASVTLDAETPEAVWTAVLDQRTHPAPTPTGPLRYRVTWLFVEGDPLESDEREGAVGELWIEGPPREDPGVEITLLSAGSFEGLAYLLAELRTGADGAVSTFEFSQTDQARTWTLPAGADGYEHRFTTVTQEGARHETPWRASAERILVVRDLAHFEVRVLTRALAGADWTWALLELVSTELGASETFEITAFGPELTWRFPMTDPELHDYKYRLTLIGARQQIQRDWISSTAPLLLLK